MSDLVARVASLQDALAGYDAEAVARALDRYAGGLSLYYAAREENLPEQRLREWIATLGLKRTSNDVAALRRRNQTGTSARDVRLSAAMP